MLFHSTEFLFYFLPAALLLHRLALIGSAKSYSSLARLCLLLATLVFYGWTHTWWLLPFAFSVVTVSTMSPHSSATCCTPGP